MKEIDINHLLFYLSWLTVCLIKKKKKKKKERRTEAIAAWTFCILHKFCFYLVFGCGKIRSETELVIFKMPCNFIYQQLVFPCRQKK